MTIQFRCPHCQHKLRAPDGAAGQQARCKCGRVVVVPRTSEPEFAPSQAVAARPVPPQRSPQAAPPYSPGRGDGGWAGGAISANPAPGGPAAAGRGRPVPAPVPAPRIGRARWPWYAGGGAAVLCLVAGVVLLFAATGKDRKPLLGIALSLSPQTLWGVEDASVGTTEDGRDLSLGYSESRGGGNMDITPKAGTRFAVVHCKLTARVADPQAVQKLVPRGAPDKDQERRRALTGQYRRFDLGLAAVVAPAGEKCALVWPVDPAGRYTSRYAFFHPGGFSVGLIDPEPPWHEAYLTNDAFEGLLEVQKPVEVAFLASVPWSLPLDGLKLQIETDPPVPLRVRN